MLLDQWHSYQVMWFVSSLLLINGTRIKSCDSYQVFYSKYCKWFMLTECCYELVRTVGSLRLIVNVACAFLEIITDYYLLL